MHGPAVVTWLLAVLAAAAGGYCLTRLRPSAGCGTGPADLRHTREADAAEATMGFGMAGMAVVPGAAWGWLYGCLVVASLLGVLRGGSSVLRAHRLHHTIGAFAMTYLALAMPGPHSGHSAHGTSAELPLLTGALLVYFGCYSLWSGSRLLSDTPRAVGSGAPGGERGSRNGTPRAATAGLPQACRVAMGIAMFAMLLTL